MFLRRVNLANQTCSHLAILSSLNYRYFGHRSIASISGGTTPPLKGHESALITRLRQNHRFFSGTERPNIHAEGASNIATDNARISNRYKIGGGGIVIALLALGIGHLYCESHPDQEVCESLRSLIGIKKK